MQRIRLERVKSKIKELSGDAVVELQDDRIYVSSADELDITMTSSDRTIRKIENVYNIPATKSSITIKVPHFTNMPEKKDEYGYVRKWMSLSKFVIGGIDYAKHKDGGIPAGGFSDYTLPRNYAEARVLATRLSDEINMLNKEGGNNLTASVQGDRLTIYANTEGSTGGLFESFQSRVVFWYEFILDEEVQYLGYQDDIYFNIIEREKGQDSKTQYQYYFLINKGDNELQNVDLTIDGTTYSLTLF